MLRKHTRRAAKAAYAISLGVALLIGLIGAAGSSAAVSKPAAGPTVVIGTKNFTEQYVLGQLYKQALEGAGFTVSYKENIGSSELIDTALTSGKINFYPEYTGVIVQVLAHKASPKSAQATYAAAKAFEEKRGYTLLAKTPFYDSDSFGMLTATATKYGVKTIADMKKVGSFTFGGFPECKTRITCLLGLKQIYGLSQVKFVPLSGISVYTALDQKKIVAGDVFSTDPQLAGSKYTVLTDTRHIFGFQNVAPIVSKELVTSLGSKFVQTVNAVSGKLTLKAMIAMNKAVAIDKASPAAVAAGFLKANKLT